MYKINKFAVFATIYGIALGSIIFLGITPGSAQAAPQGKNYVLGVFPHLPPRDLEEVYAPIAADLGEAIGRRIVLRSNTTFGRFMSNLDNSYAEVGSARVKTCIMFAFGDSITYGMWEEQGGWTERLRRKVERKNIRDDDFRCLLYNMGIPGDTAEDLKKRMAEELKSRIREGFETVIVIAIGINDSALEHAKARYSLEVFRENIESLVGVARQYAAHIAIVGLNPVNESMVNPLPDGSEIAYQNSRIAQFNHILKSLTEAENLYFVDVWRYWTNQNYKNLLKDGLHPNESGHALNANLVENYLKKVIALE